MGTQLPPKKGRAPQFSAHVYCGQTVGWIKMALGMEVGLGPGHIVLDGDPAPPPKWGHSPQFSGPCLLWPNGWIKIPLGTEVGLGRPRQHCVRWGTSSPPKRTHPQFSAHDYCGQTSVCIRMPLGMEVGLSLGDILLDADPDPPS